MESKDKIKIEKPDSLDNGIIVNRAKSGKFASIDPNYVPKPKMTKEEKVVIKEEKVKSESTFEAPQTSME